MIVTLALVLSSSNLYGYIRCKVGASDIKGAVTKYVGKQLIFNVSVWINMNRQRDSIITFDCSVMTNQNIFL